MRNRSSFCLITGIAIGTVTAIASQNIPAGICIGAGSGMLTLLLTLLNIIQGKKQKVKI